MLRKALAIAAAGIAGFGAATVSGVSLDSLVETTTVTSVASPATKSGAEMLALNRAADLLRLTRAKFVDPTSGLLLTNTYAQCFPSTTSSGWWVCGLNTLAHPRPRAWISVSYNGAIRLKGEQPLGYGYEPAAAP